MRTAPVGGPGWFDPEGTRNSVHSSQAASATVRHEGTRRSVRAHQAVGATVRSEDTRRSVRAYQAVGATVRPEGARRSVHPIVRQGVWGVVCCRAGGSGVGTVARRGQQCSAARGSWRALPQPFSPHTQSARVCVVWGGAAVVVCVHSLCVVWLARVSWQRASSPRSRPVCGVPARARMWCARRVRGKVRACVVGREPSLLDTSANLLPLTGP